VRGIPSDYCILALFFRTGQTTYYDTTNTFKLETFVLYNHPEGYGTVSVFPPILLTRRNEKAVYVVKKLTIYSEMAHSAKVSCQSQ
jgi:hypothetical protein